MLHRLDVPPELRIDSRPGRIITAGETSRRPPTQIRATIPPWMGRSILSDGCVGEHLID
jgi:hypothetical protein